MPKFKKSNTYGFKTNCFPYYKHVERERVKISPATYVRLSAEFDEMVQEAPTLFEKQEMLLVTKSYHLFRPRGLKKKVPMSAQTAHIYRSQLS